MSRGRLEFTGAIVLFALAVLPSCIGSPAPRDAQAVVMLPPLPDLAAEPSALREHLTAADAAARAAPGDQRAVSPLCLAYHADMYYEEARRCYDVLRAIGDTSWRWTYLSALASGEMGDAADLAVGLRSVTTSSPDFSPAWWRLGDAEFKAGRYNSAAEAWERAQRLAEPLVDAADAAGLPARTSVAPISAYAALGLARIALGRGDAEQARTTLEQIVSRSPRFGPAYRLLGEAYAALKRPEDAARAVAIADRSPNYDPYVDPTMLTLVRLSRSATLHLQQAAASNLSTNGAWREYLVRRAVELDPANTDALYELASVLRALGRFEEALSLLERYRSLVPTEGHVLTDIGRCLVGLGRRAEAERTLRQAVAEVDDANAHQVLALLLDRDGRVDEAVTEYRRALALNPNHGDAINNLAIALVRRGQLDEAARLLERLVASDPGNADAQTNLGVVRMTQGATDAAARAFKAALAVRPEHARAQEGLRTLGR